MTCQSPRPPRTVTHDASGACVICDGHAGAARLAGHACRGTARRRGTSATHPQMPAVTAAPVTAPRLLLRLARAATAHVASIRPPRCAYITSWRLIS